MKIRAKILNNEISDAGQGLIQTINIKE